MKTPHEALHQALVDGLKAIGYKTTGRPAKDAPIVIIDQLRCVSPMQTKIERMYEFTLNLEVNSLQGSPVQSYRVLQAIRDNMIVTMNDYTVQSFDFEECQTLQEDSDEGIIWRQIQRIRTILT